MVKIKRKGVYKMEEASVGKITRKFTVTTLLWFVLIDIVIGFIFLIAKSSGLEGIEDDEMGNAINGIINVFALGSAFLCGAFIPTYMLPSSVLKVAHVLPAYWYINSNNRLKTLEQISYEKLQPILINTVVLLGFTVLFIILNNIISKKKQKIG